MEYRACLRYRHLSINSPLKLARRHFTPAINAAPPLVGVGDAKSTTPIAPPPLPWYKQPRFLRNIVNILLLASFANSAAIILSYKSQIRELSWQSKERIQTLKETIEKVRKGEPIDIRAALGTGDPEMEKRWAEVLREIEQEDLRWQGKADNGESKEIPETPSRHDGGK